MSDKTVRSFVPFLAGSLAPFLVTGAFLAVAGEGVLGRIQSLGTVGTVVGLVAFVLTVVLPCGILGLLGSSTGAIAAFGRGLPIPLGILAFAGASRLAGAPTEPLPEPTAEMVVAESFRVVWRPGSDRAAAPAEPGVVEAAEAPLEAMIELQDRAREVTAERDALRERLRQARTAEMIATPEEEAARIERAKAVETRLRASEAAAAGLRETVARLKGQLKSAEEGLLQARGDEEDMRADLMKAREDALVARDEAGFEKKALLAKIGELSESTLRREFLDLRSRAFVPVGVVFDIQKTTRGRGLAIRTGSEASRVVGPGLLVDPKGRIIAVIRCGVGKGEALAGTVLFFAPGAEATPGDRVFAHVR